MTARRFLTLAGIDVALAGIDVAPAGIDVAPAGIDVALAGIDVAPAGIGVALRASHLIGLFFEIAELADHRVNNAILRYFGHGYELFSTVFSLYLPVYQKSYSYPSNELAF
ncbi:hypothetical protein IQ260_27375 [Leptolyngbya cf. ectocarpi LEGE 11479]|uniref:Uncharacterized protein n=1 Tax=Leptolyngbya cf. ectocarpi LEGE 11479 TaxID=1828722 RepID=A0A928ZZI3_LEPEC|nr:hypothetical protein [Leptolyngbya ectocarpi]MBE9070369.1 hypothetical protein [Leptolyngbya cf. ectocarpi LEGE 11479]